ncbi:MAG: hypothetical protein MI725_17300 [Pirellulales bacterium]|nr:hypothetical protein [Pirellulales bacterium]
MVPSRVVFSIVIGLCFLVQAQRAEAQILPARPPQQTGAVQHAGGSAAAEQTGGVRQTGWPKITMPKITMPKITMPKITMPKITMPKVTMPSMSTMFAPVSSGYKKVSAGTQKAWQGVKEIFSFDSGKQTRTTIQPRTTQPKQSFWQKLVTHSAEPAAPQTVGEWMSQPRLDP